MPRRFAPFAAFLLFCLPAAAHARGPGKPLQGLDEKIEKGLKDWEVPGLALAVVKDDKVILARGYGFRKLGAPEPVTGRTLFAIGSASKAFTAASLALLADEGKLSWDDQVTKHLPWFQLSDPYVTREVTLRDLLSHRCGLDRHELVWYGSPFGRDEVLRRIRHAKPSSSFRSKFGYQNVMFLAAGQVVPAVAGKSWDDFVKECLFKPLGMNASNTSVRELPRDGDVATPHEMIDDKLQVIPWRNIDNIGPAGSINSCAEDMGRWVRLQLSDGTFEKQRLLSSGTLAEMHKPQTVVPLEGPTAKFYPHAHFRAYGLGWFLHDYWGKKVVEHGGNIDGMSALVAMLPEEKLGVVVLTNRDGTMLPAAVKYQIFDAFLGAPSHDWVADLLDAYKGLLKIRKDQEKKDEKERVTGTKPSLPLAKYVGTFRNDIYSDVKVKYDGGKLTVEFGPGFKAEMEHWNYDTFRARPADHRLPAAYLSYVMDRQGHPDELKITIPGMDEWTVKRAADSGDGPPAVALKEEELRKFVGKYELEAPPVEVSVELVGGKLKAVVPGQPVLALVPVGPTKFKADGAPAGVFLTFEAVDGAVKALKVEVPKGPTLTLTRKK
jgi:CubicO group peptidase (beta-lactamase class C family)